MWPVLLSARWVHFAALFVLFGAPLFLLYGLPHGAEGDRAVARRWVRRAAAIAAPLALLSALAWAGWSLADITGDPLGFMDAQVISVILLETGFGRAWLLRLVLLAVLILAVWRAGKSEAATAPVAVLAGLLLVTQAWLGHAAAGSGFSRIGLPLAYGLHLLGAAAWIGGLVPLAALLLHWRRITLQGAAPQEAARRAAPVLWRFSRMGIGAVTLTGLGGAANAALHLSTPSELISTAYGQIILAKGLLFALLLLLATRNRSLSARLVRAQDPAGDLGRVCVNIFAELGLALGVLALAAVLGVTPPGP